MTTTPYMVVSPEGGKHTLQCRAYGAKFHGDNAREATDKFYDHKCRPKESREDFSQAAARIVREATEKA